MTAFVTSESFANSPVSGVSPCENRVAACTTRPSQWPEVLDSFTIRAHAAASAVNTQGSAMPSRQPLAPNISTMSASSNTSGDAELPKFGNANPLACGFRPELSTCPE